MVTRVPEESIERGRAARTLLDAGLPAEGIRLSLEALRGAIPALEGRDRARAIALVRAPLPRLDRAVGRGDVERAREALELLDAPRSMATAGIRRRVQVSVLVLVLALSAWRLFGPRPPISASASASYSSIPFQGPGSVLDADDQSNWLLPDRTTGWLELRFAGPRRVEGIEITNGFNPPYGDRGARGIEVVLLGEDGRILATAPHELAFAPSPPPVLVDVEADAVARVRIFVRSFHRRGSAIDRIRVLP